MACIARANRVAIQKVFPTRNLWHGQSQDVGGRICGKSEIKNHKEVGYLAERIFMQVSEVAEVLDASSCVSVEGCYSQYFVATCGRNYK